MPTILIILILLFIFFNTFSFDVENRIYGKVIFRACYEGTQNQSTFKLRENNRFEIHSTGVFFFDEYVMGQYSKQGDTLVLAYDDEKNKYDWNKVFMDNKDSILVPIEHQPDTTRRQVSYYYGYCKGLN